MRELWSGRQNCSHNMSQELQHINQDHGKGGLKFTGGVAVTTGTATTAETANTVKTVTVVSWHCIL